MGVWEEACVEPDRWFWAASGEEPLVMFPDSCLIPSPDLCKCVCLSWLDCLTRRLAGFRVSSNKRYLGTWMAASASSSGSQSKWAAD